MPAPRVEADLCVLGPVLVRTVDDELVAPRGARARSLLVLLGLAESRAVSLAGLSAELWADEKGPVDPKGSVQTLVSRLRQLVGTTLIALSPGGYRFTGTTDLMLAQQDWRGAKELLEAGDARAAVELAAQGIARWYGEVGSDISDGPRDAVDQRSTRLRSLLEDVLLAAVVAAGDWSRVIELAGARFDADACDEKSADALLAAYLATGAVTDGLRVYARLRESLADELGSSPSRGLQERYAALLQLDTQDGERHATPPGSPPVSPLTQPAGQSATQPAGHSGPGMDPAGRGLRRAPTPLIGRDAAVHDLRAQLQSERLVTVLGPGGLGKTRVAHEVGWRLAGDGLPVTVVELASISTDDGVMSTLALALGIHENAAGVRLGDRGTRLDISERIRERLAVPGAVLIIDNCEHVLEGAARTIATLLATTNVRVLATSRAPLEIDGEVGYNLAALDSSTDGTGAAIELFVQRARAVRSDVGIDSAVVARLCQRLDGLPLAIELAAARVRSMSVDEVLQGLDRRFALLTSGPRTGPERHRTLHAVIAWSWDMLGNSERRVLRWASVLPAGFDAATMAQVLDDLDGAAETMTDDVLALVAQSLLMRIEVPEDGTSRFRMLETVREFAALEREQAGETTHARQAAVRCAVKIAADGVSRLAGPQQREAVLRLAVEQDNLLQAFRWAVDDEDATSAVAIFGALGALAGVRGMFFELVGLVLDVHPLTRRARIDEARDAIVAGMLIAALGSLFLTHRASPALGRLRVLARREDQIGRAWSETITLAFAVLAEQQFDAVARLARESTAPMLVLVGYLAECALAENRGDLESAATLGEHARQLAIAQGNVWGRTSAAQLLAEVANERGDHVASSRWFSEAHEHLTALGAVGDLRQVELFEAGNQLADGDVEGAARIYRAAVELAEPQLMNAEHAPVDIPSGTGEIQAAGYGGLGEIAWLQGDVAGALASYDSCLARLPGPGPGPRRAAFLVHASAQLCIAGLDVATSASSSDSTVPRTPARSRTQRLAMARRLRIPALVGLRVTPMVVDAPVLGAALVALGTWWWTDALESTAEDGRGSGGGHSVPPSHGTSESLERAFVGLEMLALAERLGSRQDVPSLRRDLHFAAAAEPWGLEAVTRARTSVRELADSTAVLGRVREILGQRLV